MHHLDSRFRFNKLTSSKLLLRGHYMPDVYCNYGLYKLFSNHQSPSLVTHLLTHPGTTFYPDGCSVPTNTAATVSAGSFYDFCFSSDLLRPWYPAASPELGRH
ncbi:hypothetical protein ACP70R_027221 [Stipagrostis hirtigluma subsp. patula]